MPAREALEQFLTTPWGSWGTKLYSIKDTTKDCEYSVFLELLNRMRKGLSSCLFYRRTKGGTER